VLSSTPGSVNPIFLAVSKLIPLDRMDAYNLSAERRYPNGYCSLAYSTYLMLSRLGKTLLTATLALYFLIVAFNNMIDHETNLKFVEHVLSMDSIPADANVLWRAIRSPRVHYVAYWTIILWELTTGCICGLGAKRLFFALRSEQEFEVAKTTPIAGLWLGLLLWSLVFITIGGEWFLMWESSQWNGELPALRMFVLNAITLLFLYLPETTATEASAK
jgi:predicted small integral membrane protein